MNVDEFYQDVVIHEIKRELWDKNVTAFFSHTRLSEKEKIGLKCKTQETAMQYGKYVAFKLKDNDYSEMDDRTKKNIKDKVNHFNIYIFLFYCFII